MSPFLFEQFKVTSRTTLSGIHGQLISVTYPRETARSTLFASGHVTRKRWTEVKYGVLGTRQSGASHLTSNFSDENRRLVSSKFV